MISVGRRFAAAFISGLAVAGTVYIATGLVFFTANGAAAENLLAIGEYFLPMALVLFVLYSLAATLEINRYWYTAAVTGLVLGVAAAFFGTALGIIATGAEWNPEAVAFILATLLGTNLIFVVATIIAAITVGRRVWAALAVPALQPTTLTALVRAPSSRMAEGELTHLDRVPVDAELADAQWEGYVAALQANGFETIEVPAADELADSVFIEDIVVMFGDVAVLTSPGAESRQAETDAVRASLEDLTLELHEITQPGTLDGGDVLKVGSTVYVGRGGRTNAEGIRQLRSIVTPLGYTVIAVPIEKVLHLKSGVTALPDGTIIGYPDLVDNVDVYDRFLAVPEAEGAAVVVLSDDAVLMSSSAPKTAALIENLGYRVVTVDVSEFEKMEGCVTCLSVRIR
ncbi:dimethylarginine dimethylaminohydrolase [Salinibacterium sp. UTAS2018]|uniref:dimethylargininase n=1 Tax=Salinibacterium sp. UTAS2018 TaxID=2508880 RepID=UPI0010096FDE|nr:dimethylargininase [Salinibacterium sp. UTAS2018]QAV70164.1 dimethylarginine dimethylaminohydrolase [Salinibacterium sp. UTAS2018]